MYGIDTGEKGIPLNTYLSYLCNYWATSELAHGYYSSVGERGFFFVNTFLKFFEKPDEPLSFKIYRKEYT